MAKVFTQEQVKFFKKKYLNKRIIFVKTEDKHTNLQAGDKGTVYDVDDIGTVHVRWDRGNDIGMIPTIDVFWLVLDESRDGFSLLS